MNNIKYLYLITALLLLGCTEHFEDLNKDPAGFANIEPGIQLAKVQVDLSGQREEVWRYDLGICSPYVQHFAGSWWTQHGGQYNIVERSHWFSLWEATYPRDLKNIVDLIERTSDNPEYANINAAARIMKVFIFAKVTDAYGDVPYSEAIKGYTEKIFLPAYDRQEDIYMDFFKELDEAVSALDPSGNEVSGDLFFDGDVNKWIRFGNSLRMRLGFRLTKVDLATAKTQVEAAIAGGVMESTDDMVYMEHMALNFGNNENRGNGRSQVFASAPDASGFRLTNTLVDYMHATNDPRLTIYGGTYLADGTDITRYLQNGLVYGGMSWNDWQPNVFLEDEEGSPVLNANGEQIQVPVAYQRMQPSRYISALDAPFFHFTYAETEFLLAEAAARGWAVTGTAEEHFMKGIEASCSIMSLYPGAPEIPQDQVDLLKSSFEPFPSDFDEQMRVIHEQMWVNFFMNGAEAYANFRRTGYPELVPFTQVDWYVSGTGGVIPRRFFYPESEANQNPTNYQEAVERLGGSNDWLKRVWWDEE